MAYGARLESECVNNSSVGECSMHCLRRSYSARMTMGRRRRAVAASLMVVVLGLVAFLVTRVGQEPEAGSSGFTTTSRTYFRSITACRTIR